MEKTLCAADVRKPAMSVGGLSSRCYTVCFTFPKFIVLSLDRSENVVPIYCQNWRFSYCYGWFLNVEWFWLDNLLFFHLTQAANVSSYSTIHSTIQLWRILRMAPFSSPPFFLPDVHVIDLCSCLSGGYLMGVFAFWLHWEPDLISCL